MKVKDLWRKDVAFCGANTNLATAGARMWENDCGILPVVNETRKVVGVITDRDIAIALATRNRPASEVTVAEVISRKSLTCSPEDDVEDALRTMRTQKVRRLPAVDAQGVLQGILSVSDIILRARETKGGKPSEFNYEIVMLTLKAIAARPDQEVEIAAQESRILVQT